MRKIDVTSYKLKVQMPKGGTKEVDYDAKTFLIAALLHPQLRLTGKDVLERGPLMDKIEQCDGTLLVEEADYLKLKQAFETVQGFTLNDMTLVKRVLEAKQIDVEEKEKVKEKK
ncbi:unnamed protein product [marine sediment metagenome]|uniref:Uncharacterized protein n=1 Tax=marine sediment metagenome TaxID=412755 RepID=X1JG06_9ZZZZ